MIKYFSIKNYYSIKEENILEFDLNLSKNSDYPAYSVIGFMGNNASGKTNALNALTFVLWFMQHSLFDIEGDKDIPIESYATTPNTPSSFDIIYVTKTGNEYEYELTLNSKKIISEQLSQFNTSTNQFDIIYSRKDKNVEIKSPMLPFPINDLRDNSSIIAYAAQFETQTIAKDAKNYPFFSNVHFFGFKPINFQVNFLLELLKDENIYLKVLKLIKVADIGIEGFEAEVRETEEVNEILEKILKDADFNKKFTQKQIKQLEEVKNGKKFEVVKKAIFKHKIDNEILDFEWKRESAGTLQFVTLLYFILKTLKDGSLLIIDEFELKLQQDLVAHLVSLFQNQYENPNNAQLILSFHNSILLNELSPEQFWLAEKNEDGQTELFSAANFEDIENLHEKNLENIYRIGRLGGKPRTL